MNLYTIDTGYFKLDGGAMFGVVPKSIWNKLNPADENNMCTWAMRCLLVESGNRLVLIDCGIGDKQNEKFYSYYYLHGENSLIGSLKKNGFSPDDITDVIMTHLHFDHCGGAVKYNEDKKLVPTFPNARYWSNKIHWNWAEFPNFREKASFLKENFMPLLEQERVSWCQDGDEVAPGITIYFYNGHTEAQMIPYIQFKDKTIVYCADLMPSSAHVKPSYVMAYDVKPLISIEERLRFVSAALEKEFILFFEHDPSYACAVLEGNPERLHARTYKYLQELV